MATTSKTVGGFLGRPKFSVRLTSLLFPTPLEVFSCLFLPHTPIFLISLSLLFSWRLPCVGIVSYCLLPFVAVGVVRRRPQQRNRQKPLEFFRVVFFSFPQSLSVFPPLVGIVVTITNEGSFFRSLSSTRTGTTSPWLIFVYGTPWRWVERSFRFTSLSPLRPLAIAGPQTATACRLYFVADLTFLCDELWPWDHAFPGLFFAKRPDSPLRLPHFMEGTWTASCLFVRPILRPDLPSLLNCLVMRAVWSAGITLVAWIVGVR